MADVTLGSMNRHGIAIHQIQQAHNQTNCQNAKGDAEKNHLALTRKRLARGSPMGIVMR
jgi:hypothetical protein